MIDNFNQLTPAEDERLTLLAEECAEVIAAVMKIQRHGYDRRNPDAVSSVGGNREDLEREIGDLDNALSMMVRRGDVSGEAVKQHSYRKSKTIGPYLHHQGGE